MRKILTLAIAVLLVSKLSVSHGQDCSNVSAGVLIADDSTLCVGEDAILSLQGSQGSITWQRAVNGSAVWLPFGAGELNILNNVTQDMDYRALLNNAFPECADTTSVVTIRVSSFPENPQPGFGGDLCGRDLYPVATSSYMPLEFWTFNSDTSNAIFYPSANQPQPDSVMVDKYGTYEFVWNISDGICTKRDTVIFNAIEIPVANAGNDMDICGTSFQLNAVPSLQNSTGQWFKITGGVFNFANNNDPNTSVNANVGTYHLRWTEQNTPNCKNSDTVVVVVAQQPNANAGDGGSECDLNFSFNARPSIGAGFWELVSDSRTVSFDNLSLSNTTVRATEYGENYTFKWTEVNSFCSDSDSVVVNFYEQPVSNAVPHATNCGRSTELTALPSLGNGDWTYISGPGVPDSITALNDSVSNVLIADQQYGYYTFQWKESNGVCVDSTRISFQFFEQPIADAGVGGEECDLDFTLEANPSVGNGEWIIIESAGPLLFSNGQGVASTDIDAQNYGEYVFRWREVNNLCIDTSADLRVIFYEEPEAFAGNSGDTCGYSYQLTTQKSINSSVIYWKGDAVFTTSDSVNWLVEVEQAGEYTFTMTEANGACVDDVEVSVIFNKQPLAKINTTDSIACGLELDVSAEQSVINGSWETISGSGNLTYAPGISSGDISLLADTYGEYLIRWIVVNEQCSDADSLHVTFLENPEANAGPDQSLDNIFETSMQALLPDGMNGEWLLSEGSGDLANYFMPESDVYNLSLGKNTFTWTVENRNCIDSDTVNIFVYDIFIPDLITPNGDNDNDYFEISGIENTESVEVTIFNRWGNEVFYSSNYQNSWDGTGKSGELLTNDTYFYVVNIDNNMRVFKGFVMLNK